MLTRAILSGRALDWPLVQTRMHTTSVPSEGAPRQPVTMNPAGCGQLIQLQHPLENVWPITLQERSKTEKEELTLLKSPVFLGQARCHLLIAQDY